MENFTGLQSAISSALVSTTRSAGALANEDLSFHRTLDASLSTEIDKQNSRILALADRLLGAATTNTEIVRPARLKDLENVEDNWRAVIDVVDSLLERADTALDEFTGAVRRLSPDADNTSSNVSKSNRATAGPRAYDIPKPQLQFEHVPTNRDTVPFKPLLQSKPHARTPLSLEPVANAEGTPAYFPHPYQDEIVQYSYPSSVYTQSEPIKYAPFEETTAIYVDTEESLAEMLKRLRSATEIAIDLEHHDSRSFIGVVSLMQISTRDQDWIVDTLKPWRRKLQCLNEVFADPNIVKVLHGAYMDVVWLQRDLGLYLVGLFDTHYAARALGYAGGSLAFLLKKFVDFDAQKQYQMADWRVRPLPQELLDYARSDTHFLLYIFDCMRNELIERSDFSVPDHEKDKIWDVLQKSSETALQRYEHPVYDAELGQGPAGWYKLLSRTPASFSKQQLSVFRAVHQWRDEIAREQDDSTHYIMPNHNLFTLAKAMPSSRTELLGLLHPMTKTVRERAGELIGIINAAKENGETGPEMLHVLSQIEPRNVRRFEKAATDHHSSTSVPVMSAPGKPTVAGVTSAPTLPLRTAQTEFWGRLWRSVDAHAKQQAELSAQASELFMPLPVLTAEVFADHAEQSASDVENESALDVPAPEPEPEPAIEQDSSDVFILKNKSKKRKQVDSSDSLAAQSDKITVDDDAAMGEESQRLRDKAERKRAKRAMKAAARSSAATSAPEEAAAEAEPFDYASAPSILNPPRETFASAKERKKKERQLNPYAKAMDTSKGLARVQKEKAGRSMTFKS